MKDVPGLFDGLIGVLTFQVFVTPAVLIVVYYLGALLGPLAVWRLWRKVGRNPAGSSAESGTESEASSAEPLRVPPYLSGWRLWPTGLVALLLLELAWRMLFEFLIVFFDMHDALIAIRNQS